MSTAEARREAAHGLFSAFDLDGNGAVGLQELLQVVQSARKISSKQQNKRLRMLEAEVRQAVETNRKLGGGMGRVQLKTGGLVTFAAADGEPSLDPEAFTGVILGLTQGDSEGDFENFVDCARDAVDDAKDRTQGSAFRRSVWSVFQLLDVNQDGFVDMDELAPLLEAESKHDKKAIAQWRSVAAQKQNDAAALAPIMRSEDVLDATGRDVAAAVASATGGGQSPRNCGGQSPRPDAGVGLSLADFQSFMQDFVDGDTARLDALLVRLKSAMQEEYNRYLHDGRVNDVLDAIVDDLIRERPHDVLDGIARSVERLRRTGTHARSGLRRVQSSVRIRDFNSPEGRRSSSRRGSGVNQNADADAAAAAASAAADAKKDEQ